MNAACVTRLSFAAGVTAAGRGRKKLTLVGKTHVLTYAHDLWMRTFNEVGQAYEDVERSYHHVDACCMYLVTQPETYDVVVTTNMFGDIITDLGAAIAGGMGVAASGNLTPTALRRACLSPCTARPQTSPARIRPTPSPRSCRWRCCWSRRAWSSRTRPSCGPAGVWRQRRPVSAPGLPVIRSTGCR